MPINQKGFAHLFLIIILVAGIGLAVYLVQQKTNLFPWATSCPVSGPCPTIPPPPIQKTLQTDFNGDGKSDLTVFRTSNNTWYVKNVFNLPWGRADKGDIPVPGDYNGDGKADLAVFNPNTAEWSIQTGQQSKTEEMYIRWGGYEKNEVPVQADYNGDGITDYAVWLPGSGTWYVSFSTKVKPVPSGGYETGSGGTVSPGPLQPGNSPIAIINPDLVLKVQWGRGSDGDIPVPGDYDGDGKADFAVYHPSNQPEQSFYYIKFANGQESNVRMGIWDGSGAIPVAADYNGDGRIDPAVWDPLTGEWRIPGQESVNWGKAGNIPVVGDFNGDGKADYAVWDPSNGFWYIKDILQVAWGRGDQGDIPLPKSFTK